MEKIYRKIQKNIENANLIFKIKNMNKDYYGEMDSTNFEKQAREQLKLN